MDAKFIPLKTLKIVGFRAFQELTVPSLGQVNLIVGKNGVGKSSLLEALWIYMNQASPLIVWQILEGRDEGERTQNIDFSLESLRHLFWGRERLQWDHQISFSIGDAENASQMMKVSLVWPFSLVKSKIRNLPQLEKEQEPGILIEASSRATVAEPVRMFVRALVPPQQPSQRCVFIPANGLDMTEITSLWDRIALTQAEEEVLSSLQLVAPQIAKVNMIVPQQQSAKQTRIPVAKLENAPEPVPLRSLGEGLVRLLGIAMAMANARNGMLLIDEIESGLHYTVQADMWKLIFSTARRLNIQVFATTHSWDCISAFQEIMQSSSEAGMLIRLERKNGGVLPTVFDARKLAIAAREQIEVR